MVVANEQAHLKKVLSDTIPLLCKSSLGLFNSSFSVEAIVGITVNEKDVLLVSFKETVLPDGSTISLTWQRDGVDTVVTTHSACSYSDNKEEDASDEATSAQDSTQVLYDDTNSGSNEVLESMEEAHFVSGQTSNTQPPYKEENDWKEMEEYSYQATSTRYISTEDGEGDGSYRYSAEPTDWESVGRALQSEPSVGDVDEIDCSIVKIEKREMEMDFGLTFPGKPDLTQNNEATRSGHTMSQRGLRRRGLAGNRRVVPRSGLQFAQKRLQARKQPAVTSRTANKHSSVSSRVQQWSASQGMPQDPYDSMADAICRTAIQQSMVTVEKQYICRICQARLSSTNNLMAHIQGTHLALDRYQCHICLEKFRWYMQLHRHRKRCHSEMFPPSTI